VSNKKQLLRRRDRGEAGERLAEEWVSMVNYFVRMREALSVVTILNSGI
jgi:hypothetical protein